MRSEPKPRTGPAAPETDDPVTVEALAREAGQSSEEFSLLLRRMGIHHPTVRTRITVAQAEQIRRLLANDRADAAEIDRLLQAGHAGRPPFVEVFARQATVLMALPGVEATVSSRDLQERPFIRVYLSGPDDGREDIPRLVEGYPVLVQAGIGEIVPAAARNRGPGDDRAT